MDPKQGSVFNKRNGRTRHHSSVVTNLTSRSAQGWMVGVALTVCGCLYRELAVALAVAACVRRAIACLPRVQVSKPFICYE
eukprot:537710-Pleurochrysis_carterae.AAC.1